MARSDTTGIYIHEIWREETELWAHVYAPNIDFYRTGSHHFRGPFRIVVDIYDNFESREQCSFNVWRWFYRNWEAGKREMVTEAHMLMDSISVKYKRLFCVENMPENWTFPDICPDSARAGRRC